MVVRDSYVVLTGWQGVVRPSYRRFTLYKLILNVLEEVASSSTAYSEDAQLTKSTRTTFRKKPRENDKSQMKISKPETESQSLKSPRLTHFWWCSRAIRPSRNDIITVLLWSAVFVDVDGRPAAGNVPLPPQTSSSGS